MSQTLSTFSTFKHMMINNPDLITLSDEDLVDVQNKLLEVMDDIHAVCKENGLVYFMSGGNALGAVRHGGFIPWDDDIDLYMPRSDYRKFRDCMIKAFPDKYYVQEIHACPKYDLNFMKVRLNGTVFCECLDAEPEKAGLFVDIFPMENVANNRCVRMLQHLLSDGMLFITSCVRIREKRALLFALAGDDSAAKKAIQLKARIALPFSIFPLRRWLLWTDRVLSMIKNENTALVSVPSAPGHFKGEMFARDVILPTKTMKFCDRTYEFMAEPEVYLEQKYGDYMTIPPVEQRERHMLLKFNLNQ